MNIKIASVAFLLSFSPTLAQNHQHGVNVPDWYPTECCHNKDCEPVPCDSIGMDKRTGGLTYRGLVFKKEQEKPSKDSSCHVCIYGGYAPLCVFTLQGS